MYKLKLFTTIIYAIVYVFIIKYLNIEAAIICLLIQILIELKFKEN